MSRHDHRMCEANFDAATKEIARLQALGRKAADVIRSLVSLPEVGWPDGLAFLKDHPELSEREGRILIHGKPTETFHYREVTSSEFVDDDPPTHPDYADPTPRETTHP